jgi:cysteine-rich repeat protein
VIALPDNEADPFYELFLGDVVPLYCTDFENDPSADGWTHNLTAGQAREGADDWQFGIPRGTAGSGDPSAAYSGSNVYGNDLGGGNYNGKYQPEITNVLASPIIDTTGFAIVRLQYRRWLTVEDGFFDRARILANDMETWSNKATDQNGEMPHQDKEWRFQDVDLSPAIHDGHVQVIWELASDGGLEFGGWTLDDVCIVGYGPAAPVCGDGVLDQGEACDDGNVAAGDGCNAACTIEEAPVAVCGNGTVEVGEQCDDGNVTDGDACNAGCTLPDPTMMGEQPCTENCTPPMGMTDDRNDLDKVEDVGCGCTTAREQATKSAAFDLALLIAACWLMRRRLWQTRD